jgi:hypothetical protein
VCSAWLSVSRMSPSFWQKYAPPPPLNLPRNDYFVRNKKKKERFCTSSGLTASQVNGLLAARTYDFPSDVWKHFIFRWLSPATLASLRLVSRKLRCITPQKRQDDILYSLFQEGSPVSHLQWFEKYLRYPIWGGPFFDSHISRAAEGWLKLTNST